MIQKLALVFFITGIASCIQTENSNSFDRETYGSGSAAIKSLFAQHCVPCHSFQAQSDAELIANGLVTRGDVVNSKIYYRLVGSSGSNGPKDMPSGSSLSQSELAQVETWILNL